jgi:DNA ligase-1
MTDKPFKPFLATSEIPTQDDLQRLSWPRIWSPKLDGIRTMMLGVEPVSRKLKLLPNEALRFFLARQPIQGFDGEMVYGPTTSPGVFNHTQSKVMKVSGPCPTEANGKYLVFDDFTNPNDPFVDRFARLTERVSKLDEDVRQVIQLVPHESLGNLDEMNNVERIAVEAGYEGIMLRDPNGRYKFGRGTLREGLMLKIKRFADVDCEIIATYEMMHNDNEKIADALGHGKRSSHQENMRPSGMLGGFTVQSPEFPGETFGVGPGTLAHDQRKTLWEQRDTLTGKMLVAKYQPSGMKDAPRFAGFKAFRED